MYCPDCGTKNNAGAKFCSECGCKFVTTSANSNEQKNKPQSEPLKSKVEYIKELESNDTGYQTARVIQVLFFILFGLLGIIGSLIMRNEGFSDGAPWLVFSLLCFLVWIIDGAYLIHKNNQFRDIYEEYLRKGGQADYSSPSTIPHERYWDCPNCGRCNDNIITICKCGERKP